VNLRPEDVDLASRLVERTIISVALETIDPNDRFASSLHLVLDDDRTVTIAVTRPSVVEPAGIALSEKLPRGRCPYWYMTPEERKVCSLLEDHRTIDNMGDHVLVDAHCSCVPVAARHALHCDLSRFPKVG
jgi:hypothetical protein